MSNLLYITCNVRPLEQSRTLTLGNEFLEEYQRLNPQDEIEIIDLYRDSIQRVDQDLLNAWERVERGEAYVPFSDEERRKMSRVWRLAEQFSRCDKLVFVTHSLNLWFPAEFKMYIDTICVLGRTYCLTPRGAENTMPNRHRKSLHLHADQPFAFGHEPHQGVPYLRSMLNFFGVIDQQTVLLEGDTLEQGADEAYETARHRVLKIAHRF